MKAKVFKHHWMALGLKDMIFDAAKRYRMKTGNAPAGFIMHPEVFDEFKSHVADYSAIRQRDGSIMWNGMQFGASPNARALMLVTTESTFEEA